MLQGMRNIQYRPHYNYFSSADWQELGWRHSPRYYHPSLSILSPWPSKLPDKLQGEDMISIFSLEQKIFQENVACEGWTLVMTLAEFPNYCFLFSTLGLTINVPSRIRNRNQYSLRAISVFISLFSGPPSCLCSNVEACHITEENELELVANITEVNN